MGTHSKYLKFSVGVMRSIRIMVRVRLRISYSAMAALLHKLTLIGNIMVSNRYSFKFVLIFVSSLSIVQPLLPPPPPYRHSWVCLKSGGILKTAPRWCKESQKTKKKYIRPWKWARVLIKDPRWTEWWYSGGGTSLDLHLHYIHETWQQYDPVFYFAIAKMCNG